LHLSCSQPRAALPPTAKHDHQIDVGRCSAGTAMCARVGKSAAYRLSIAPRARNLSRPRQPARPRFAPRKACSQARPGGPLPANFRCTRASAQRPHFPCCFLQTRCGERPALSPRQAARCVGGRPRYREPADHGRGRGVLRRDQRIRSASASGAEAPVGVGASRGCPSAARGAAPRRTFHGRCTNGWRRSSRLWTRCIPTRPPSVRVARSRISTESAGCYWAASSGPFSLSAPPCTARVAPAIGIAIDSNGMDRVHRRMSRTNASSVTTPGSTQSSSTGFWRGKAIQHYARPTHSASGVWW
jgi:hypothetical protein